MTLDQVLQELHKQGIITDYDDAEEAVSQMDVSSYEEIPFVAEQD